VDRAAPYLEAYDIGVAPSGRQVDERGTKLRESDRNAKANLKEVLKMAKAEGMEKGFDEGDFFTGPDAVVSAILSIKRRTLGSIRWRW
jgi:hypothetical protein